MSYQVGWACYKTLQDAGTAACSNFLPVTSVTGGGLTLTTISCQFSGSDGTLQLKLLTAPISGGVPVASTVAMPQIYHACQYQDFLDGALIIFSALLGLWAVTLGFRKIIDLLNWSRGES